MCKAGLAAESTWGLTDACSARDRNCCSKGSVGFYVYPADLYDKYGTRTDGMETSTPHDGGNDSDRGWSYVFDDLRLGVVWDERT